MAASGMVWPLVFLVLPSASCMQLATSSWREHLTANATSAQSKRAECSAFQVGQGCCTPLGDTASAWTFASFGTHGTWSSTPAFVRYDFHDDTICGGVANARQHGNAVLSLNDASPIDLTLSMTGVAEANFEKFQLFVDNVLITTVQASNGHGGSACQVSTCIMCDVNMPSQTFSLSPGVHTIKVEVDSSRFAGCTSRVRTVKSWPALGGALRPVEFVR
ncbi:unnamed protein product [Prorocentrum cordatum]|uniref:Uncharacterized protein n=1 Tax=Prorocentrum cordatum TaxID=2364126 RepID=A0ABN9VS29_9DINO|nr:unnamed protein product [Polarella glacialis]